MRDNVLFLEVLVKPQFMGGCKNSIFSYFAINSTIDQLEKYFVYSVGNTLNGGNVTGDVFIVEVLAIIVSFFAKTHEPDKAFFEVAQKEDWVEIKAEFPWTVRDALLNPHYALGFLLHLKIAAKYGASLHF